MSARLAIVLLALASAASCGIDQVSAGVEVVESNAGRGEGAGTPAGRAARPPTDGDTSADATPPAMTAAGINAAEPDPPVPAPRTVAVVGDSLTRSARDQIDAALSGLGLEVLAIDGVESRRMVRGGRDLPPGADAIDDLVAFGIRPDLWVVALGTNDVGAEASPAEYRDDVAILLSHVPAGAPVVWVDVWIRDQDDDVLVANDALRDVAAIRPGTTVVDWHRHGAEPGIITDDGIHLTDVGRERFAGAIAGAVAPMLRADDRRAR